MLITFAFHDQIGFSSKGAIIGYTTMVVAFLMVFFGVRAYREHVGGTLSFGRALWVGLLIMGIASACYVATWEVIYWKLAPDFGEKYAAYEIEKARQSGATDAQLAARRREMEQFQQLYRNPLVNVALTFLEPLPVGVVMTLVAAGMLRKRKAVAA
jgi:hypothetical protein